MCACEWKEQTRIILRLNHFSILHLSHLLKTPPSPLPPLSTNVILLFVSSKNIIQLKSFSSSSSFIHFISITYIYINKTCAIVHPSKNTLLDTTKKKLTGVPHCVRSEFGPFTTILANPKSAIFMLESSVGLHSSKFSGFKSRCATLNE